MSTTTFVISLGLIFILILLIVLLAVPTGKKSQKKKGKQPPLPSDQEKEWLTKIAGLHKHIHSLQEEIASLKNDAKAKDKQLAVENVRVKKLQEKLGQERQWQKKEQQILDKRSEEFQQLKNELLKIQAQLSHEHALNLKLESEGRELKQHYDALQEKRRSLESRNAQLEAKNESLERETARLRQENAELRKEKEDTAWIAKSEYDKIHLLLKEKEKELERLKREQEGPSQ